MKGKRITILCFSAVLTLIAFFGGIKEREWSGQHSITAEVFSDGRSEEVKLWMGPGEMYYLFLPGYADLSQTQIRRQDIGPVYLDYKKVAGSMDCSDFPLNEPVTLIQDSILKYRWNELTIMQSGNVPTMFIDVKSGNMDYIHAQKGNKESGTMRLYTADGELCGTYVLSGKAQQVLLTDDAVYLLTEHWLHRILPASGAVATVEYAGGGKAILPADGSVLLCTASSAYRYDARRFRAAQEPQN